MNRQVHIAEQVVACTRRLGPEQRRAVKKALVALRSEQGDICPLEAGLSGFYRLRSGRYRLIFAYRADGAIDVIFMEERRLVYELFEAQFIKKLKS